MTRSNEEKRSRKSRNDTDRGNVIIGKDKSEVVGGNRTVSAGDGSVVIGGDVKQSVIVTGDHNRINFNSKFGAIYKQVDERADLPTADKSDLKSELQTFEDEDKKGPESNEGFLAQRLRNIKRIAPDILDVALATITSPAAGFGMIAKKVAEKMKAEGASAGR